CPAGAPACDPVQRLYRPAHVFSEVKSDDMAVVELRDISASYGENQVLDSVSLTLAQGEFVAVLGPSGCGKTTLLRVVAGFVEHSGTVAIAGQPCEGMPPHKRNIGIVFQDYALFPHRTVRENIGFGLRLRKL